MSVGSSLSAARQDAELSLDDVAERTRIRRSVIEAIERDDFEPSGGAVYARGHVRSIATAIGIDPAPLVAEFDADHQDSAPSASEVFEAETSTLRGDRRGANWSAIMAAALVVAVALLGFQLVAGGDEEPRETVRVSDLDPTPTPTVSSSEPSPEPSETEVAAVPTDLVTLRIAAVGTGSWVEVTNSHGDVEFTGTLSPGQSRNFRDERRLNVVIGNAAGVQLVVNGTDLGVPGGSGEVLNVSFRPGDPDGSAG